MTRLIQKTLGAFILAAISLTSFEATAAPVLTTKPEITSTVEQVYHRRHHRRDREWSRWEHRKHWRRHHHRREYWDDDYGYREYRHHRRHRNGASFGFYFD